MAMISRIERERRKRLYLLGLKQCTECEEPLPLEKFGRRSDGYRGLYSRCKRCVNSQTAENQKRTPDYQAHRQRRWRHANRAAWLDISRRRDARVRWGAGGEPV
ncbi:MAG: hypothetical protein JWN96_1252 [Mycobacterium sp.]|nr:hypothetical protein [Mycobacterium sp.]